MSSATLSAASRAERIVASPRARRAALRRGLDAATLRELRGSGPGGRIVEADVVGFEKPIAAPTELPAVQREVPATQRSGSAGYLSLRVEVDASALIQFSQKAAAHSSKSDQRIELTDVVLWAFCTALRGHAHGEDVAVLGADGAAPRVIRAATKLGLPALARHCAGLTDAPETQREAYAAYGFFDAGKSGVDEMSFPPADGQTLSLGVGAVKPRAFVIDGALSVCPTIRLCLNADSNRLNPAEAASLLATLAELFEEPEAMVFRGV